MPTNLHASLKKEIKVIEGSFNRKRLRLKDFIANLKDLLAPQNEKKVRHLHPFLSALQYVLFNGFLINIVLTIFTGFPFNPPTILASGIAWWYFREELTEWIRVCRQ